jgi:hypothetical protein
MPDWKSLIRARVAPLSELDAAREADIVDELAQHVAEHYAELVAAGVAGTDAVERALAPFNDPARIAREIARADRPRRSAPAPPPTGGSWWGTSAATCATHSGCCAAHQDSPRPPSSPWRSASVPTSRSSALSARWC